MNYIIFDKNWKILASSTNKEYINKLLIFFIGKGIDCNCIIMTLKEYKKYMQN